MASNPKIPDLNQPSRRGPTLVPKPEPPASAFPGVILAIVTALLLLGAVVYFMPRAPRNTGNAPAGAVTPTQPANGQVQFSDVTMSVAPVGGAISIDAQLTNSGTAELNGVMAEVDFPLSNGQMGAVQVPVLGVAVGKSASTSKATGDTEDLTKSPIKPGETRPVRISVNEVPASWNHQIPQIRVAETTGAAAK